MNRLLKIFVLLLLPGSLAAQICSITSDTTPPAVNAGATHSFTASSGCTAWSVSGGGTINASTGVYTAPATVWARDVSRGWQLLPDNSAYKLPINSLPVDSHSAYWLQRQSDYGPTIPAYHHFHLLSPGGVLYYDNVVNNSTPTQLMHFRYGGDFQNTNFRIPLPPNVSTESGWSQDLAEGNQDQHVVSINNQTGEYSELYAFYPDFQSFIITAGNPTSIAYTTHSIRTQQNPLRIYISGITGGCSSLNGNYLATIVSQTPGTGGVLTVPVNTTGLTCSSGTPVMSGSSANCPTCNGGSGMHWSPYSNALDGGTDAAGVPFSATSVHTQELWNVVQQNILDPACGCVTLGHAILTDLGNAVISPRDTWPTVMGFSVTYGHPDLALNTVVTGSVTTFNTIGTGMAPYTPCAGFTWTFGCTFHINIGYTNPFTSTWAAANGDWVATMVDNNHFTIPLNSTGFPALPVGRYFVFDWLPYGSHVRLKSSFNVAAFCSPTALTNKCPYEKAILNTMQIYGMVVADGTSPSDAWGSGLVSSEFDPDQINDAVYDLNHNSALQPFEPHIDIVDIAGQQVNFQSYTDPTNQIGMSNYHRVTVTVTCGGCTPASLDVLLQGTAIGTDLERISMVTGTTYQINSWVTGNASTAVTYSMSPPVTGASVSSTGIITAPSTVAAVTKTTVTITSTADPTANLYIDTFFIPVSSDGKIRLAFGEHATSYTDTGGKVWWGQNVTRAFNSSYEIGDGLGFSNLNGTWQFHPSEWISGGTVDPQLYAQSTSITNDANLTLVVPNGNYNLSLYGEPGYGTTAAGQNVYDVEVQGAVQANYQDGFLLSGSLYHGYIAPYTATVSNGLLQFNGRIRQSRGSYGISLSSLLIEPTGVAPLTITSGPCPAGNVGVFYMCNMTATGGTPPYTWSFSAGGLTGCPGLSLTTVSNVGVISGTPSAAGSCSFTEEVTDAVAATATQPLSITIVNVHRKFRVAGNTQSTINWNTRIASFSLNSYFSSNPGIQITSAPPFGSNGSVSGTVSNVNPNDYKVGLLLFIPGIGWWTKPFCNGTSVSFVTINSNNTWSGWVGSGGAGDYTATKYAAYLVGQDVNGTCQMGYDGLPLDLESRATARAYLERPNPQRILIPFAGQQWETTDNEALALYPGPCWFSQNNEFVDGSGNMHLTITQDSSGFWHCAQVAVPPQPQQGQQLPQTYGYGTYKFNLASAVDGLDPNVVFGLFTWSDDPAYAGPYSPWSNSPQGGIPSHSELDVEFSRWGDPNNPYNAQFVVQPYTNDGARHQFLIPPGYNNLTVIINWFPDGISFQVQDPNGNILATYNYAGAVPPPGDNGGWLGPVPSLQQVRLNLWLFNGNPPQNGRGAEVVISGFVYLPYSQ
jgi:hypothetical protein